MDYFKLLPILTYLISVVTVTLVAASHGDQVLSPEEAYWNSVLPNTPMPNAVKDLINVHTPEWTEGKSTSVTVGKGGTHVGVENGKPGSTGTGTHVGVGKGGVRVSTGGPGKGTHVGVGKGGVGVSTGGPGKGTHVGVGKGGVGVSTGGPGKGTYVGVGKGGVGVSTGGPGKGTHVGVGKGGVGVTTPGKGKPVIVRVLPGSPFLYRYAATEDQLHDNPNVALFFLEKDMRQAGTKMNLQFTKSAQTATFLPRQVAEKIPFSSEKLPEILDHFAVKPNSMEAETMKKTINECEEPGIRGEEKYCATSLESLVDFSISKLGKSVRAISTEVERESSPPSQKYYSIVGVKKMTNNNKAVVCHKQDYVYAVFYCHETNTVKTYMVSLVGADGTKAKAVAVCHTDTSAWNPKHLAFQVLKVKPGTVPVCHFLPEDHLVWVPY